MKRKREVEFRPYTKESLLAREVEVFAEDEEESTLVDGAPQGEEIEDGMHAVEDEAEPLDFSEDADSDGDDNEDDEDE